MLCQVSEPADDEADLPKVCSTVSCSIFLDGMLEDADRRHAAGWCSICLDGMLMVLTEASDVMLTRGMQQCDAAPCQTSC